MQVTITQISMKLTNDNEVVAYASIVFNDSVKINGVKIKKNDVGKLLGPPPRIRKAGNCSMLSPLLTNSDSILTNSLLNIILS